jgi:methylenetetrahydrofolate dehydrogenase (NADP+)/methenyltetrahydrofolate cyclohydrolase
MSARIIDGRAISKEIRERVREEVAGLVQSGLRPPALAVVLVGKDPASQVYVRNKKRACHRLGITSIEHLLDETVSEKELLALIGKLNRDPNVDGILIQLPLPGQLHEASVLEHIDPRKDVDGFHPINVGRLVANTEGLRPCTPAGIVELLKRTGEGLVGKKVIVLGRSNIVGKPTATMLLHESCTVTVCHSKTRGLKDICLRGDILVAALGQPRFVTPDMVKAGAIVIDVGINRNEDRICGDVDFDNVKEVAGYITPVPGGVGPMTIGMLMVNTLKAYKMAR